MKKFVLVLMVLCLTFSVFANGGQEAKTEELSAVQQIIKQAESMTL